MVVYDENEHYTVNEISVITGLTPTTINQNLEIPFIEDAKIPGTNRPSKILKFYDFENYLSEKKVHDFTIEEFKRYSDKKRPIVRQFFSVPETVKFMKENGLSLTARTITKNIHENKYPSYQIRRKFLIPILHLIKLFALPIDQNLNATISKVINQDYTFKL